jgi:prepilin-type N-terminal cleavage/methylation domain-containing protein
MRVNMPRHGFTLVEMLVALILTGLILAVVYRTLVVQQRTLALQAQRSAVETNLRTGAAFFTAELREVSGSAPDTDLLAVAAESVTYRAMRGTALACHVTGTVLDLLASSYRAYRQPQPGRDSVLVYVGADSAAGRQAEWLAAPVNGVAPTLCAGGAAVRVSTVLDSAVLVAAVPGSFLPVRLFEVMQVKLYRSQGATWLGAHSVSAGEVVQPVLGPLESNGLGFSFLDSAGLPTTRPSSVRTGMVNLRALSSRALPAPFGGLLQVRDSVQIRLPLRNAAP